MIRLVDLSPTWIAQYDAVTHGMHQHIDERCVVHSSDNDLRDLTATTIEQAQGVLFLCPVCFKENGGAIGTEHVLCWFRDRGVPDDATPGPGRWVVSGTSFADLTLSPSVNVGNEHWHGFIQNGDLTGGGI